ncbi:hypothetical protein Q7P37_011083 [Cladosporium fusiforme]
MTPSTIIALCILLVGRVGFVLAQDAGYLAATFNGQEEQVFFQLAPASSPQSYKTLNGGRPYLVATQGTQGARDPSILKSSDGSKLYVFATDLNIARTDWGAAQTFGSRAIHVWESTDGINWTADRLATLMPATAGYVWAPSAIWDPSKNQYAIFWSSRVYAETDTNHTGTPTGPFIYYSHTSDFNSFSSPQRWNTNDQRTVIDQEIQHLGGSTYIRYLSDTADTRRVVLDRSTNGLFGDWHRLGVPVDALREDDYSGDGYECYYTEDWTVPFPRCPSNLSPQGMRHGGVATLEETRFNALSQR